MVLIKRIMKCRSRSDEGERRMQWKARMEGRGVTHRHTLHHYIYISSSSSSSSWSSSSAHHHHVPPPPHHHHQHHIHCYHHHHCHGHHGRRRWCSCTTNLCSFAELNAIAVIKDHSCNINVTEATNTNHVAQETQHNRRTYFHTPEDTYVSGRICFSSFLFFLYIEYDPHRGCNDAAYTHLHMHISLMFCESYMQYWFTVIHNLFARCFNIFNQVFSSEMHLSMI